MKFLFEAHTTSCYYEWGLLWICIRSMDKYGPRRHQENARRGCLTHSDAGSVFARSPVKLIRLKNILIETFGQEVDELIRKNKRESLKEILPNR